MKTNEERDRQRVLQRLEEQGFGGDLWGLRKQPEVLARAAPLLLELLAEIESRRVKIHLLRVASDTPIPPAPLVAELRLLRPYIMDDELDRVGSDSTYASGLAWDLAAALVKHADVSVYDDLVEIIRTEDYHRSRQMLPYALAQVKSRREDTIRVLLEILDDEDITPHVLDVLGKMKVVESIPAVRKYLDSPIPLVKSTAKSTLKKLEKVQMAVPDKGSQEPLPKDLPPIPAGLVEASTNFDLEQLPDFLEQVASLVEGLGDSEVARIESHLFEMEPDQEAAFDFTVHYRGEETHLHIRIFMSDVGAPDVGFFTSLTLAEAIDQLMENPE